jgi:hypothetical protein
MEFAMPMVQEMIAFLKGKHESGINWQHADFGNEGSAEIFLEYLRDHKIENRGIYYPQGKHETYSIRFR